MKTPARSIYSNRVPSFSVQAVYAVAEDAEVAALLQDGYTEVVGRSLDVVGNLPGPLSAARPDIRIQEMPLANVICSAMIAALNDTVRPHRSSPPLSRHCQSNIAYESNELISNGLVHCFSMVRYLCNDEHLLYRLGNQCSVSEHLNGHLCELHTFSRSVAL